MPNVYKSQLILSKLHSREMFFEYNRGNALIGARNLPSLPSLGDSSSQLVIATGVGGSMQHRIASSKSMSIISVRKSGT